jgi:tetratricopeptide (TPR) repeat protein
VTSSTSAFEFKVKNSDILEIGIHLNVDRILEGSVLKSGNRVRITAQLINAADGYHIWSENYDRDVTDIFEVQDEISNIIANKLRENLSASAHNETLVKVPTRNLEAYTLFLKGLYFYNKLTPADSRKAIECFENAIQLEPGYALAYAMAAMCYTVLGATGQMLPGTAFEIVHRYSDKALQLDATLSAGYAAKGSAYLFYDWEWKLAYEAIQKSIDLNPAATGGHQLLAFYYQITGRKNEAVNVMEKALQVDPVSPIVNHYLAEAYLSAGRPDDAIKQVDRLLDLYPEMRIALQLKGWCLGVKGNWEGAALLFEEVRRLTGHPLKGITALGCAFAKLGETEKALQCLQKIEQRQVEEPAVVLDADMAMICWALGRKDQTFDHLFRCVEKRMGPIAILIEHPMFSELSVDPRFKLLKERLNLAGVV